MVEVKSVESDPATIYNGISYEVQLRATPGRSADGLPADGVMWSADLVLPYPELDSPNPGSLTASAITPDLALAALREVIVAHARDLLEPAETAEPPA